MASALATSFLGAFEASLSVLITLGYGVLAARLRFLHPESANDISQLCVKMFLPALLITNVGSQISVGDLKHYIPVFLWSLIYTFFSMAVGKLAVKAFKLPAWVMPACAFNNTTSLPLLLTESLATTGILASLVGDSSISDAVERAKSYFLINSMVSNALTFSLGPRLLASEVQGSPNDSGGEEDASETENDGEEEQPDESSRLLPKPVQQRVNAAENRAETYFSKLPPSLQKILTIAGSLVNAPLVGAFIAVFIGLTPPLHKAFFAETQDGGVLNAWLTSSLKNIGQLFTSLQMFTVGSKLNDSLSSKEERGASKHWGATAFILFYRFVFCSLSILIIYGLANKGVLGDDPMLWFSMMLLPVGPPAMILSSLAEIASIRQKDKMAIARLLTIMYALTPLIFVVVVGALEMCKRVLDA